MESEGRKKANSWLSTSPSLSWMMGITVKHKQIGWISFSPPSHPPHQIKIPGTRGRRKAGEEQESCRHGSVSGPRLLPQPQRASGSPDLGFADPSWNWSVSQRKKAEMAWRGGRSRVSAWDRPSSFGDLGLEMTNLPLSRKVLEVRAKRERQEKEGEGREEKREEERERRESWRE